MKKIETLQQCNAIVQTTEEYTILAEAIKQQGGYITHTSGFNDGLSVIYMIPKQTKE